MTFAAAATRWWTEAGQHRKDARDMVRALAWMQANVGAATKIASIDANLISRLVAKRRSEGVSNSTVNRSFVEPLRAILMRAEMEWGQNVAKIAWRRHKLKEPPGRVRAMTRDEREKLFSALDDRFAPVVRFLLASGVRRAEACGLRWSQVDLDAGRMSVPVKGGDVNHVPLSDAALLVIKSQIGLHPDFVFTYITRWLYGVRGGARVPIVPETLYTAFRRALASAGLSGIRLHDTRHTAASRVLAETGSLTAAQRMLGHKDIKTTQRYAHLSDDQLRAALNAADPVEKPKKSPKRA